MLPLIDFCLQFISPHICKGCGQLGSTYCERCIFNALATNYHICVFCGGDSTHNLCDQCQREYEVFDDLICLGERSGSLKRLVGDYKYNSEIYSANAISKLIYPLIKNVDNYRDFVIVPSPTISRHIRKRGFDHTALLAKKIAQQLEISVDSSSLRRRNNLVQHINNRSDRLKLANESVFCRHDMTNKRIILLDDIWTTGATMMACASKLRDKGATSVIGVVIVRQPHDR